MVTTIIVTSSHCIAVVSLCAIKIEVRLFANVFSAFNISDSVVLSSALVASSQSLRGQIEIRIIHCLRGKGKKKKKKKMVTEHPPLST